VWECDPTCPGQGLPRPALGKFNHEAVAVDPVHHHLYLTEDKGDGLLYRFTPTTWRADGVGVLDSGLLEAAVVGADSHVTWLAVPDPSAVSGSTRGQLPAATRFHGGEGAWYDDGTVYFTTKGDKRVWTLDTATQRVEVLYDATPIGPDAPTPLSVDNVTVSPAGDVLVAEDSSTRKRMLLLAEVGGVVTASPFLEVIERDGGSELTGPVFDPSGTRLYFSSQRGASIRDGETEIVRTVEGLGLGAVTDALPVAPLTHRGITYEVTGPFRQD
jgi:secreted PhoX family phosphatase